jgi:hypothetical protein
MLYNQQVEQDQILTKILALQTRLAELKANQEILQSQITDLEADYLQQEMAIIRASLDYSYKSFLQAGQFWATLTDIRAKRQALLSQDPYLEDSLNDYQVLAERLERLLGELPPSYRDHLLAHHQELERRLTPYRELLQAETTLQYDQPVVLQVVVARGIEESYINWVIPFPADLDIWPVEYAHLLEKIATGLLNAIIGLAKKEDWHLENISTGDWLGYAALLTVAEYTGSKSIADLALTLLQDALTQQQLPGKISIEGQVIEVPNAIWQQGLAEVYPSFREETDDQSQAQTVDYRPLVEKTNGWYDEIDVKSWERRMDTGSAWNEQARRVRTTLIRMVGRGKIGSDTIQLSQLWQNLPEPHQSQLHQGLAQLIERRLLLASDNTEQIEDMAVSLNPVMLTEIQSLINRNITDFWQSVLRTASQ